MMFIQNLILLKKMATFWGTMSCVSFVATDESCSNFVEENICQGKVTKFGEYFIEIHKTETYIIM